MNLLRFPRQLGNQHLVYVETTSAEGDVERLAVTDRALSHVQHRGLSIQPPPRELVEALLEEAEVVLDDLCASPDTSVLRDKLLRVIKALAGAEAIVRTSHHGIHNVVSNRVPFWSLRPEHPSELARGVRRHLGLGYGRLRPVPWAAATTTHLLVRRGKHARHSVASTQAVRALLITGNESFERAVAPVRQILEQEAVPNATYDESLNTSSPYPGVLSILPWSTVISEVTKSRDPSLQYLIEVWQDHTWWGKGWLEEARTSLAGICRYYLTVAELYTDAFRALIDGVEVVVTPQSASVQLRALLRAADQVGVPVVVIPHGLYTDGAGWVGLAPACFAVTGERFAQVLRRRGFAGRIELVGATFFEEYESQPTDVVIALRPIEMTSIASREALSSLIVKAVETARELNPGLRIGVRPHPRQKVREILALIHHLMPEESKHLVVDHKVKGRILVGPESSFIAQARIEGIPVVLTVEPGMPTLYGFENLPGVFLAQGRTEMRDQLAQALSYRDSPHTVRAWRSLLAVDSGQDASARVLKIVLNYLER